MSQIQKITDPNILNKIQKQRGQQDQTVRAVNDTKLLAKIAAARKSQNAKTTLPDSSVDAENALPVNMEQQATEPTLEVGRGLSGLEGINSSKGGNNNPNYLERISSILSKRGEGSDKIFEMLDKEEMNLGSAAFQTVGKTVAGTGLDVLGETVGTVASAITPDVIEEPFKQGLGFLIEAGNKTDIVQDAKEAYGNLSPEAQGNIDSATNLLTGWMSKMPVGSKIKNAGTAIRKTRLSDAMKVPETVATKVKDAKNFFQTPANHMKMINVLDEVPGFKGTNKPEKNLILVEKELKATERKVQNLVNKTPVAVSPKEVLELMQNNMDELVEQNIWLTTDKAINAQVQANMKAARRIIAKYSEGGLTTKGLLRARRDIDRLFGKKKVADGKGNKVNVLQAPVEALSAMDAISQVTRRAANEVIAAKHPKIYKDLMFKEHQLLNSVDILAAQYGASVNSVQKAINFAKNHPIGVGVALNGGGMILGLATNPIVLGGTAAATSIYAGYRALPSLLTGAGKVLEVADKVGSKVPRVPISRAGLFYGDEETNNREFSQ
tara:strand:+ start:980 stop:2635 length:1656 start_codon:yes stop_codon:yes gene_type:complete